MFARSAGKRSESVEPIVVDVQLKAPQTGSQMLHALGG
jgi:hypothetical protein